MHCLGGSCTGHSNEVYAWNMRILFSNNDSQNNSSAVRVLSFANRNFSDTELWISRYRPTIDQWTVAAEECNLRWGKHLKLNIRVYSMSVCIWRNNICVKRTLREIKKIVLCNLSSFISLQTFSSQHKFIMCYILITLQLSRWAWYSGECRSPTLSYGFAKTSVPLTVTGPVCRCNRTPALGHSPLSESYFLQNTTNCLRSLFEPFAMSLMVDNDLTRRTQNGRQIMNVDVDAGQTGCSQDISLKFCGEDWKGGTGKCMSYDYRKPKYTSLCLYYVCECSLSVC